MFTVDGVKMAVQLVDCFILISTEIDDFIIKHILAHVFQKYLVGNDGNAK